MSSSSTGDLLGAASLALGALAIFYSLWSAEIEAALSVEKKRQFQDRSPEIKQVNQALRTRAWPLFVSACVVSVLLAPPVIGIVKDTLTELWRQHLHAFSSYDAVSALLVAVWMLLLLLASLAWSTVIGLKRRATALKKVV